MILPRRFGHIEPNKLAAYCRDGAGAGACAGAAGGSGRHTNRLPRRILFFVGVWSIVTPRQHGGADTKRPNQQRTPHIYKSSFSILHTQVDRSRIGYR